MNARYWLILSFTDPVDLFETDFTNVYTPVPASKMNKSPWYLSVASSVMLYDKETVSVDEAGLG